MRETALTDQEQLAHKRATLLGILAAATVAGGLLISLPLWYYGPTGVGFLPACAAGITFTWVIALSRYVLGPGKRVLLFVVLVVAGTLGGFAWWAASSGHVSLLAACASGGVVAPVWALLGRGFRGESS